MSYLGFLEVIPRDYLIVNNRPGRDDSTMTCEWKTCPNHARPILVAMMVKTTIVYETIYLCLEHEVHAETWEDWYMKGGDTPYARHESILAASKK